MPLNRSVAPWVLEQNRRRETKSSREAFVKEVLWRNTSYHANISPYVGSFGRVKEVGEDIVLYDVHSDGHALEEVENLIWQCLENYFSKNESSHRPIELHWSVWTEYSGPSPDDGFWARNKYKCGELPCLYSDLMRNRSVGEGSISSEEDIDPSWPIITKIENMLSTHILLKNDSIAAAHLRAAIEELEYDRPDWGCINTSVLLSIESLFFSIGLPMEKPEANYSCVDVDRVVVLQNLGALMRVLREYDSKR